MLHVWQIKDNGARESVKQMKNYWTSVCLSDTFHGYLNWPVFCVLFRSWCFVCLVLNHRWKVPEFKRTCHSRILYWSFCLFKRKEDESLEERYHKQNLKPVLPETVYQFPMLFLFSVLTLLSIDVCFTTGIYRKLIKQHREISVNNH